MRPPLSAIGNCHVCGNQMVSHIEEGEVHHWTCAKCLMRRRNISGWFMFVVVVVLAVIATVNSR